MEAIVMKVLTSLLILTLMTASVVTERLHIEKNGKKHVSFLYSTRTLSDFPHLEKGKNNISE